MVEFMREYITEDDLDVINYALSCGTDVKIKATKDGVTILRETSSVLREKEKIGDNCYGRRI